MAYKLFCNGSCMHCSSYAYNMPCWKPVPQVLGRYEPFMKQQYYGANSQPGEHHTPPVYHNPYPKRVIIHYPSNQGEQHSIHYYEPRIAEDVIHKNNFHTDVSSFNQCLDKAKSQCSPCSTNNLTYEYNKTSNTRHDIMNNAKESDAPSRTLTRNSRSTRGGTLVTSSDSVSQDVTKSVQGKMVSVTQVKTSRAITKQKTHTTTSQSKSRRKQEVPRNVEVCNICLDGEKPLDNKTATNLECGHRYHAKCIKRWLKRRRTCPVCRSNTELDLN